MLPYFGYGIMPVLMLRDNCRHVYEIVVPVMANYVKNLCLFFFPRHENEFNHTTARAFFFQ